jgi:acyl-CoA thioesterase I
MTEETKSDPSPHYPLLQRAFWYAAMGPLELYARATGIYNSPQPLAEYPVRNSPAREGPIVAFGDSLTAGYGTRPPHSYPAQLSRLLRNTVINAGANGDTAEQGLQRIDADVLSHEPAVVIIGFGGNDLMQRRATEQCFACQEQMIERIQATGALTLLLGIRGSWLYGIDFHTPFRELAIKTGSLLVPCVLDSIWGVPWRMHDAAHPNVAGYRIIAQRIAAVLRPHL